MKFGSTHAPSWVWIVSDDFGSECLEVLSFGGMVPSRGWQFLDVPSLLIVDLPRCDWNTARDVTPSLHLRGVTFAGAGD